MDSESVCPVFCRYLLPLLGLSGVASVCLDQAPFAASTSRQEQQQSRKGRVQVAVTEAEEGLFSEKQLLV